MYKCEHCCSLHNWSVEDVHVHAVHHNPRTTEFLHLENNWPLVLGKQWCPIQLCSCFEICSAKRHKDTVCCVLASHQKKEMWSSSIALFWKIMCHRLSLMKTDIKRFLLQGGCWFWQCEILIAVTVRNCLPLSDRL